MELSASDLPRDQRRRNLWIVGGGFMLVSFAIWGIGRLAGQSLLSFFGFMLAAGTFVPLPADSYVLAASPHHTALAIGVVGGLANVIAALVEQVWLRLIAADPSFDRFRDFIGSNRLVVWTRRHLFLGLLIGGVSFIPFEPFRLVAALSDYPRWRYALATFAGRGFRYYWLARAGKVLTDHDLLSYIVWGTVALFAIGLFRSYRKFEATVRAVPVDG